MNEEKTVDETPETVEVVEEATETKSTLTQKAKGVVDHVQARVDIDITVPSTLEAFMDHQKKAIVAASEAFKALIPGEVRTHARVAINESVQGYRELFNSAVDEVATNVEKVKIPNDDAETNDDTETEEIT